MLADDPDGLRVEHLAAVELLPRNALVNVAELLFLVLAEKERAALSRSSLFRRVRSLNCIAAPFFRSARGGTRCKRHKARFLRFVRLPFRGALFYFKLGSFPYLRK